MPRTTAFANDYLEFICHGTTITALSGVTDFYVSLHTAAPGLAGDQTTNECSYLGYAREAISRDATDLPVTDNVASFGAAVAFGAVTAGDEMATHFGVGTASSGAGYLLWYGTLSPEIPITTGAEPQIGTGTTFTAV